MKYEVGDQFVSSQAPRGVPTQITIGSVDDGVLTFRHTDGLGPFIGDRQQQVFRIRAYQMHKTKWVRYQESSND